MNCRRCKLASAKSIRSLFCAARNRTKNRAAEFQLSRVDCHADYCIDSKCIQLIDLLGACNPTSYDQLLRG